MLIKIKKCLFLVTAISLFFFIDGAILSQARDLGGSILLQVEQNGEAWYVDPSNEKRIFLGLPINAFDIMRKLGLGVSNKDFELFETDNVPIRLSGRILIKVEDDGRAFYVNPSSMKMMYLGRPADAFDVMKSAGIGITDLDLIKISISEEFDYSSNSFSEISMDIKDYCISDLELDLADKINKYRASMDLGEIPMSASLSYVAKIHLKDLVDNNPITEKCNAHSWSGDGPWQGCCYPENTKCIQSKARELTDYMEDAVENIHWWDDEYHTPSPDGALDGWIESEGHNIVIVNEGWAKDFEWLGLGVAIYKNYAAMWVGAGRDTLGAPLSCGDCSGILNKDWRYNCYADIAIKMNDKKYCAYIDNSLEKEYCEIRTDVYSCSSIYNDSDFECYKELIIADDTICSYLYDNMAEVENCINFSKWN